MGINELDGIAEDLSDDQGQDWPSYSWPVAWMVAGAILAAFQFFPSLTNAFGGNGLVWLLVTAMLVATYTDLRWRLIPNWLTYSGIVIGLAVNFFAEPGGSLGAIGFFDSIVGFFALFVGLLVVFSISGGGAGDVKLVGMMGAVMGISFGGEAVCLAFVSCAVLSLGWSLVGSLRGKKSDTPLTKTAIPLAPYFAIGVFIVLVRNTFAVAPEPFVYF